MSIAAFFAAAFLASVLVVPGESMSQSAPAPAPAPAVTPPDFPQYIVTPRDDLNPYDLSTMQKSTETDYRQGAGTLGTSTRPSSNIEVNEALQKSREEREKAAQKKAEEEAAAEKESGAEGAEAGPAGPAAPSEMVGPEEDDLSVPGVRGSLFTWTDENGVLHATNDLGKVPIEYQIEALENSKGSAD